VIGLDTKVLVRYIVEDEPEQAALATQLIDNSSDAKNPAFMALLHFEQLRC